MDEQNEDLDVVTEGADTHAAQGGIPGYAEKDGVKTPTAARTALVKEILKTIAADKKHWAKTFKRMRDDIKFADGKQWGAESDERYVCNVVQRHVQQRVSSLYAKNPTVVAKRRKTLDFVLWDEKPESLMAAQETMMMAQQAMGQVQQAAAVDPMGAVAAVASPQAQQMMQQAAEADALINDVLQGMDRRRMLDRIGNTLAVMFSHYMTESTPPFKTRAKQLVRRTVTTGVGYIKIGFQRMNGHTPDWQSKIADFTKKIAHLQSLATELQDGKLTEESAGVEELKLGLQALQQEEEVIIREGLTFDFPKSTALIPSAEIVELVGWVGCPHLAQEFSFTPRKIREIYGISLKSGEFTPYGRNGGKAKESDQHVCVYEYYDTETGLVFTVAEGHDDFLEEPKAPNVQIDQFYPFFVLAFNTHEPDETDVFPKSDVHLMRHPQKEINRTREALRQHRIANAPKYAAAAGALDGTDQDKFMIVADHGVVTLKGMKPGDDVNKIVQRFLTHPLDPALYDTEPQLADILRAVGSQEANLGPTSGGTATESSIAEGSRLTTQSSCIDDMDEMLSLLARAGGQIMFKEIHEETAKKIAGVGAVWPELTAEDRESEIYLEIAAGSSGRPNKAQEQAALEKLVPLLIQIPGIPPRWLASKLVQAVDDKIDLSEAYVEGMPSITSMNTASKASLGTPAPGGPGGDDNAEKQEKPEGSGPGGQPGAMAVAGGPPNQ